jgi:hypothetical protein
MSHSNGIAHVSFMGGGMFLPARSAWDRQLLIENVLRYVARHGQVQILVDAHRWLVQPDRAVVAHRCGECGLIAQPLCRGADGGGTYCIQCALGRDDPLSAPHATSADADWRQFSWPSMTFGRA